MSSKPPDRTDLYALSDEALDALIAGWGHPPFRARQLRRWLFEALCTSFADMTDLPGALRERLERETRLGTLEVAVEQHSRDGTQKRLYRLGDGQLIEAVRMPYADGRRTACISSQVGCAMGCVFCATGQMGFVRNLSAAEIYEQAHRAAADLTEAGERLSNVVLMGMGEPLHNTDAVLDAIRAIHDRLGIGYRRITLSTVGLVPEIRRLADAGLPITLAVSLHAADDATRSALLPVNRRYDLAQLLAACRDHVERTSRRITFEWALIAGENDGTAQADALADLLRGLLCHVNLIPLNPTAGYAGGPTAGPDARGFAARLEARGIPATVRVRRGIDIDAGCGQLRDRLLDP